MTQEIIKTIKQLRFQIFNLLTSKLQNNKDFNFRVEKKLMAAINDLDCAEEVITEIYKRLTQEENK